MQNNELPQDYFPLPYDDGPRKPDEQWWPWATRVESAREAMGYRGKRRYEDDYPLPAYTPSRDYAEQDSEHQAWVQQREILERDHRRRLDQTDALYDAAYTARWRTEKERRKAYNEARRASNLERRRRMDQSAGLDRVPTPEPPEDSGDELYERPVGYVRTDEQQQQEFAQLQQDQQMQQQQMQQQQTQDGQGQGYQGPEEAQPGGSGQSSQPGSSGQLPRPLWPDMPPVPPNKKPRCQFCFLRKKRCDVREVGVPCTMCDRNGVQCLFTGFISHKAEYKMPRRSGQQAQASTSAPVQPPVQPPVQSQLPVPPPDHELSGYFQPQDHPVQQITPQFRTQSPLVQTNPQGFDQYQFSGPGPGPTPSTDPRALGRRTTKPKYLRCQKCKEENRKNCNLATNKPCTYCEERGYDCVQQRGPGRPPKDGGRAGDGNRTRRRGIGRRDKMAKRGRSASPQREKIRCNNCRRYNKDCDGGRPCWACQNDFLLDECADPDEQPFNEPRGQNPPIEEDFYGATPLPQNYDTPWGELNYAIPATQNLFNLPAHERLSPTFSEQVNNALSWSEAGLLGMNDDRINQSPPPGQNTTPGDTITHIRPATDPFSPDLFASPFPFESLLRTATSRPLQVFGGVQETPQGRAAQERLNNFDPLAPFADYEDMDEDEPELDTHTRPLQNTSGAYDSILLEDDPVIQQSTLAVHNTFVQQIAFAAPQPPVVYNLPPNVTFNYNGQQVTVPQVSYLQDWPQRRHWSPEHPQLGGYTMEQWGVLWLDFVKCKEWANHFYHTMPNWRQPPRCNEGKALACDILAHTPNFETCRPCHNIQNQALAASQSRAIDLTKSFLCQTCADQVRRQGLGRINNCLCSTQLRKSWVCHNHREAGIAEISERASTIKDTLLRASYGRDFCIGCASNPPEPTARTWGCVVCKEWVRSNVMRNVGNRS